MLLFSSIPEGREKTLAPTILSSPGREGVTNNAGCSRSEEGDSATTTIEVHQRNPAFVKDQREEYISKLEDHLEVRSLIVSRQKSHIIKLERHMKEMDKDCRKKIKKVNDVWKYKISKEGTRAGKMLKMSLQNQSS